MAKRRRKLHITSVVDAAGREVRPDQVKATLPWSAVTAVIERERAEFESEAETAEKSAQ